MTAADLDQKRDYPNFPEFARAGIDLSLTNPMTILTLQEVRDEGGFPIFPGLLQGNWGRAYGNAGSRHYAVWRLSDAGDVFAARGRTMRLWLLFQANQLVNGLGLYLDTRGPDGNLWPMIHFDLRPIPRVFWIRDGAGAYWTEQRNPVQFWRNVKIVIERDVL